VELNFAICTDLHFGPEAFHHGKLRKLTAHAGQLLGDVIAGLNRNGELDLIVNLGDDIEDESHKADLARYRECIGVLDGAKADRLHIAGNHDTINLSEAELRTEWSRSAPWAKEAWAKTRKLYYSLDRSGVHFVILHTHEEQDQNINVEDEQLEWLAHDLASTDLPVIVFMHHSAADQFLGGNRWFEGRSHVCLVRERKRLRKILE
jgi:Icc protein